MYPRSHKPLVKKDKTNANQKLWDKNKDKNKTKSYNPFSINSQRQAQAFKKDKRKSH